MGDVKLSEALGCSHHVAGIHGLVGRDEHKPMALILACHLHKIHQAENIVLHGGRRILFHQRNVFICGGVKYDLGPALLKDRLHLPAISNIGDMTSQDGFSGALRQFAIEIKHSSLVLVNTDQNAWFVFKNLAAKFRADGSSRASYQHGTVMDCPPDRFQVDGDRVPAQQILDIYIAEVTDAHSLCDDVPQSRYSAELHRRALAHFHETLHLLGRG